MSELPRKQPRVAANIGVIVRIANGRQLPAGQIRNISLGGVFIETADLPAFGSALELEFSLPDQERRTIRCQGFVAWTTKTAPDKVPGLEGIGVRLADIGIQEMRALAAFIDNMTAGKAGATHGR